MDKNQELEELYDTITQIYIKNINYFSKNHQNLINKINDFEKLNIENYFLEFENNHFQLKDKNGNVFYNCDPFLDAQKRCLNIKDKPCFSLIKTEEIINHVHYDNGINAYEFINELIQNNPKTEEKFEKFIFMGTQLGVHINDLDKLLKSKVYLILEDSIEIFRLSMFLTDYESLENNAKIFYCIEENENSFRDIIKDFHSYKYEYNNFIHFEILNETHLKYVDILVNEFKDLDPFNYPFSEYLISLQRTYKCLKQAKNGILTFKNKLDFIKDKPLLFLGAGPSLAKECEWIYLNQDKFILVCAAAALRRLELLDIVPDIIFSVDGQKKQVLHSFNVDSKFYKDSICIVSTKTDEDVIRKIDSENLFFMQDNLQVFDEAEFFTGLNVGDVGLKVLLKLGAKEIYLLGFDSAISSKGKTHDGIYKQSKISQKDEIIKVKGNFEKEVDTLFMYKQMINSFNEICSSIDKNVKIYNLSHGAYFTNTIPLKCHDITFYYEIDKYHLKSITKKFLKIYCIKNFSKRDVEYIKEELIIINKIKNDYTILSLNNYKSIYKNSISIKIIEKFCFLMNPYNDFFKKNELFKNQLNCLIFKLGNIFTYS